MTIGDLRNQIKYLEGQVRQAGHATSSASNSSDGPEQDTTSSGGDPAHLAKELEQSRELVRSLNSINSELRSQIDVLASR